MQRGLSKQNPLTCNTNERKTVIPATLYLLPRVRVPSAHKCTYRALMDQTLHRLTSASFERRTEVKVSLT